ncbi:hypothetical protein Glove_102g34 [Diversispora epigaea]|uniref:Uncharacterized protein n=1 Tax=Diversispora epigaea TaxID=1348612 RepID=A0A397J3P7_9GLOM|nr:hypothetical protein Glove_102g34 [Diversispora epigaea]
MISFSRYLKPQYLTPRHLTPQHLTPRHLTPQTPQVLRYCADRYSRKGLVNFKMQKYFFTGNNALMKEEKNNCENEADKSLTLPEAVKTSDFTKLGGTEAFKLMRILSSEFTKTYSETMKYHSETIKYYSKTMNKLSEEKEAEINKLQKKAEIEEKKAEIEEKKSEIKEKNAEINKLHEEKKAKIKEKNVEINKLHEETKALHEEINELIKKKKDEEANLRFRTTELFKLRRIVDVRVALEYIRSQNYRTGKSDVPLNLKEPVDAFLKTLTEQEKFKKSLVDTCNLNHVSLEAVKKCIGGLYHTASKPIHSQTDLVVCEKDWEVNEIIALGLIFRYFRIDFIYLNDMEFKVDYPYKIKLHN